MASLEYVAKDLGDAAGRLLVLMQEGDSEHGFTNVEWADEMFDAYEHVKKALACVHRAASLDN